MAENHFTTNERLEDICDTILGPMETFITALVTRAKDEDYPYVLKVLVARLRADLENKVFRPVTGRKIRLELRKDGWWIGPFEFMTQAVMAQIELETE
jgi:hypothetical protein